MSDTRARPSRAFLSAAALIGTGIVSLCTFVASREWFSRDDFAFLGFVRKPGAWSWLDVYLPFDGRFWFAYRPLGMETYFYLGNLLFDLEPFGYFAVSLTVHFLSGALVYRLARQLDFATPLAIVAGLLAVSRAPSLSEIFYGSIFHYVAVSFFELLAVSLFLDASRGRGRPALVGACVAVALALLCNESAAALPALLLLVSLYAGGGPRAALRRVLAPALITATYLVFRFLVFAPPEAPGIYAPTLDSGIPLRIAHQLLLVLGDSAAPAAAALLVALALLASSPPGRALLGGRLLRLSGFLLAWCAVAMLPFALLPFVHLRFSMVIEAPVCLLFVGVMNALHGVLAPVRRRVLEGALLVVVAASVPLSALLERAEHPIGGPARRFASFVESQPGAQRPGTRVVILYGAEGLASPAEADRFGYLIYQAGVLKTLYPGQRRSLRMHDARTPPTPELLRPDLFLVRLREDLSFEVAESVVPEGRR